MIAKFGSVAEIQRHCGWTGNVETSWKPVSASQSDAGTKSKTLAQIDGLDSILYWVDLTTEMAFYLPHHFTGTTFASLPLDRRLRLVDPSSNEMKILIVWLEESFDQLDSILDGTMKSREISIIGIHPLKNHLFRISLNSNAQRFDLCSLDVLTLVSLCRMQTVCASLPLIDGMVLPLHILPFFLRQAVHNLSRRKRLEDSQR